MIIKYLKNIVQSKWPLVLEQSTLNELLEQCVSFHNNISSLKPLTANSELTGQESAGWKF